jgi:hypothetical protein
MTITINTKFCAANSTSNHLTQLTADELAAASGGGLFLDHILDNVPVSAIPPINPPTPSTGGSMGLQNAWAVSRDNVRRSN